MFPHHGKQWARLPFRTQPRQGLGHREMRPFGTMKSRRDGKEFDVLNFILVYVFVTLFV